ncbi:hypothetical protein F5878DRAFT_654300 [Lentinula raphanica]|uniref:DUF4218 domain-containing protein n=1 Tax=Lentinula raphanica TaxID=153919 RepID=A0AA38NZH6_9AGAR|nr:hypothetical protein F5878DRAFT_654300 [Lentinula raphanica]
MHILENIIPMLVDHWTGSFKGLDAGNEDYELESSVWSAIGQGCVESSAKIPSSFGCRIPNIETERHFFKAETWLLFATIVGPVLLRRRFKRQKYYDHFILLVKLIYKCLQFRLTHDEIDDIEQGFAQWVTEYERLYYQYQGERLCACTLPVHALLHIAKDIRAAGPVWCYWAFVMERFCGSLLRTVKNRKYPFTSLAHRVRDIAQLNQIKLLYGLSDMLNLSDDHLDNRSGFKFPEYPNIVMSPPQSTLVLDNSVQKKIVTYLTQNHSLAPSTAKDLVSKHVRIWGKLRIADGGDTVHSSLVSARYDALSRDRTAVKRTAIDHFVELSVNSRTVIMAIFEPFRITAEDALDHPYTNHTFLAPFAIDVNSIECVVARIYHQHNEVGLIDRAQLMDLGFARGIAEED